MAANPKSATQTVPTVKLLIDGPTYFTVRLDLLTSARRTIDYVTYTWRDDEGCFRPFALDVLTLRGDRIEQVTAFIARSDAPRPHEDFATYPDHELDPAKIVAVFERFGLPQRLV